MADNFWHRIRQLYRNVVYPQHQTRQRYVPNLPSSQPVVPQPVTQPVGPLDMSTKMSMLSEAGKRRLMVKMKYDGQERLVEPYSFRDKSTGRLFYGWCSIHSKIHSFRLDKIETLEYTDIAYSPRWEVEL